MSLRTRRCTVSTRICIPLNRRDTLFHFPNELVFFLAGLSRHVLFNRRLPGWHICLSADEHKGIFQRDPEGYLIASLTSLKFYDCRQFYDRITSLRWEGQAEIRLGAPRSDVDYKDCALILFSASPFVEQRLYYRRHDLTVYWNDL